MWLLFIPISSQVFWQCVFKRKQLIEKAEVGGLRIWGKPEPHRKTMLHKINKEAKMETQNGKSHISMNRDNFSHYGILVIYFGYKYLCFHIKLATFFHTTLILRVPTKECTLYYILLLKHLPISSQMINFAIIRIKATRTDDPLCSTFIRERPFEALYKNI